ncbi:MAG: putative Ig domain-containing protein, partial [Acidimicrobiia bacterium]|nr:putative Ig domain-containing protein [Acidimicrobiia bacterium]
DLGSRVDPKQSSISLSAAATDPDGDALLYSATGLPPGLTINSATGLITGTTAATATATHTVTITVTDNGSPNLKATDTFTWTIANGTPTFLQDLTNRIDEEGASINLSAAATDADGDTLMYSAMGLPSGLSINASTGLISGTIPFTAEGSYAVMVTVEDGGVSTTDAFTWTVTNTNRHPVFNQDLTNRTNPENGMIALSAAAIDPDGDALTYSATLLPAGLTINPTTGLITGTLTYDAAGSYAVTITVRDGVTATADFFVWTITNTNRPPVMTSLEDFSVAERNPLTVVISSSDPDNDLLALTVVGLPTWATFKDNLDGTATVSGTPSAADEGTATLTVTASDGEAFVVRVFSITVTVPNQPPRLDVINDQIALPDEAWRLRLIASDPDGPGATISIAGAPSWVTIRKSAGGVVLSGTPAREDAGRSTITATATDAAGDTVTRSFRLEVQPSNRPPTIETASRHEGREGFAFEAVIVVADPDGDPVFVSAENLPSWATLERQTQPGSFRLFGVAPRDSAGTWPVRLIASDGAVETRMTVTIVLKNWLQPPTATADVVVMEAGSTLQIRVLENDHDVDGVLRVIIVGQPDNGFARVLPGGVIGYEPNAHFTGKEIFSYTIEDADGQRATTTVTVNVLSADVFPVYSEKEGTGVFALGLATTQEPTNSQQTHSLGPTEGLSVAFSASVESLRGGSIYYLLLGILIAWLLLLGVGRRHKSDTIG